MMGLVAVEGLSKTFSGATSALQDIRFTLGEGRCTALLGPNGAGKTTTIRILSGLLAPSSGSIRFRDLKPGDDHRALIGYLPQTPAFHGWMTGAEFLRYAAGLCGLPKREAASRSAELLERVGIADAGRRRIAGYSGGMKQRLGLAQALIHRPKLLILDEPVSALDPIGRREVMQLLGELKHETTILFSTHVLHDAEELCDDVLIMKNGRIVISGAIDDIRAANREPVMVVEVENTGEARSALSQWVSLVSTTQLFHSAELQPGGNAAKLRVENNQIREARRIVLQQLLDRGIPVTKLEFGSTTLEDLFMKAVQHV
ncbi:ABC transporter ATP-binding protein [Paenibacillus lignilyticus]